MAGNWKMNLDWKQGLALVEELGEQLASVDTSKVETVVLPPFVDIRTVQTAVEAGKLPIAYGAQDISAHESGAYTGEVRSEEHTSELQSRGHLVCRLLLE